MKNNQEICVVHHVRWNGPYDQFPDAAMLVWRGRKLYLVYEQWREVNSMGSMVSVVARITNRETARKLHECLKTAKQGVFTELRNRLEERVWPASRALETVKKGGFWIVGNLYSDKLAERFGWLVEAYSKSPYTRDKWRDSNSWPLRP